MNAVTARRIEVFVFLKRLGLSLAIFKIMTVLQAFYLVDMIKIHNYCFSKQLRLIEDNQKKNYV